jgi:hypothetical protein
MRNVIQQLHDIEVNGGISWPEDGKILVYLGCPLDPAPRTRMHGEALVNSFAEAEAWLVKRARQLLGKTFRRRKTTRESVVQRLYSNGIPGSAYWVYDGAFGVTLANQGAAGVTSWSEAEEWLAEAELRKQVNG